MFRSYGAGYRLNYSVPHTGRMRLKRVISPPGYIVTKVDFMRKMRRRLNQPLRIVGLLLVIGAMLGGIFVSTIGNQSVALTPTDSGSPTAPGVIFPAVPSGGTQLIPDYTYFHPSGFTSLPHFVGWDLPTQGSVDAGSNQPTVGEEVSLPSGNVQITRVGSTFINGLVLGVIHAFAEKDPNRKTPTVQDLDGFYTKANLDAAWSNFKGGWKELNRGVQGNLFVINFELYLDTDTYLGRQVSQLNGDWLMAVRLVVPNNNPQLLDTLQNAVIPKFKLWNQALSTPLNWRSIADTTLGYVVKFPPDWTLLGGTRGTPYTVTATLGADTYTLVTHAEPKQATSTEAEARAYMKTAWPNSTVQTVKAVTINDTPGFAISYQNPDTDGNLHSALATLLNGKNGTLYVIDFQSSLRKKDLLDESDKTIPVELSQVRNSFFTVPADALVPTLTPTVTPVTPTEPPTATTAATTVPTTAVPPTAVPPTSTLPATRTATTTIAPTATPVAPTATGGF